MTRCFRPDRNYLIDKRAWLATPKSLWSRAAVVSWSTVSKAVLKSSRTGRVTSCLSILASISLWTLIKAVSVEWNWQYDDWFVGRGACSLQWLRSCEITVFSSNFWHKWKVAYWMKVLKYWVYIEFFKQWYDKCNLALLGIQLLSNEKLIILVMIGVTVSTHFLISQVGIGSSWQLASDDDKMILRIVSSDTWAKVSNLTTGERTIRSTNYVKVNALQKIYNVNEIFKKAWYCAI